MSYRASNCNHGGYPSTEYYLHLCYAEIYKLTCNFTKSATFNK